jgi:predicted phosphodiesterase
VAGAALSVLLLFLLVPPRGELSDPEYYANGPDIPAALRAIDNAQNSSAAISEELDAQLVGLARLIAAPGQRGPATHLGRLTLASDLHNNLLALPALERAVDGGTLVFAGDLTDRGSPFESALTARVAHIGDPVVFVAGNHDSDTLVQGPADAGVIVLGREGRLLRGGRRGKVIQRVAGLRMAGYESPNVRLRRERYRDRGAEITDAQRQDFADWLRPLIGKVDVVVAHEQGLTETAAEELRRDPPASPLALLTGHTHIAVAQASENLVQLNGGSAGGGGTGNLADDQPFGLAVLLFDRAGGFEPRFVDTVEIDADSGAARAERLPVGAG